MAKATGPAQAGLAALFGDGIPRSVVLTCGNRRFHRASWAADAKTVEVKAIHLSLISQPAAISQLIFQRLIKRRETTHGSLSKNK